MFHHKFRNGFIESEFQIESESENDDFVGQNSKIQTSWEIVDFRLNLENKGSKLELAQIFANYEHYSLDRSQLLFTFPDKSNILELRTVVI